MTGVHPVVDRTAATSLGAALRRIGYTETALDRLLDGDEAEDAVVAERRLPDSPLATVVRALYLQLPIPTEDAVRALGREAVDALAATGLAEVGAEVLSRARILPLGDRLVASLTPRLRVERALDVGTGSGVQALLAARHARHVVATDVNARALAYTELNAALNGLTNIDCRQGGFLEPVAGERFDLVTC